MAAAPGDTSPLDALFERLNTCIKGSQHKKAIKAADESAWRGVDGLGWGCWWWWCEVLSHPARRRH